MTASDLDAELRATAERTAEAILQEARATAERLTGEADRSIGDRRERLLRAKEAEYAAEARRAIATEKHEAMQEELRARTRVVERVLERVRARLPEVARSDAYRATLPDELTRALAFVGTDDVLVRCSNDLHDAIRTALGGRTAVRVEPDSKVGPGFVVSGGGGSVLVDGQLQTRVDRLAPTLAIEIHQRLAGG